MMNIWNRKVTVFLTVFALGVAVFVPVAFANDEGTGTDLEQYRSEVVGMIAGKISNLTDKAGSDEERKDAVSSEVATLGVLTSEAVEAVSIGELEGIASEAHSVYSHAVSDLEELVTPESQRDKTIGTINYKIKLLSEKQEGSVSDARKAVFAAGVVELAALKLAAKDSDSVKELRAMEQKAHDIYYAAKESAEELGDDTEAAKEEERREEAERQRKAADQKRKEEERTKRAAEERKRKGERTERAEKIRDNESERWERVTDRKEHVKGALNSKGTRRAAAAEVAVLWASVSERMKSATAALRAVVSNPDATSGELASAIGEFRDAVHSLRETLWQVKEILHPNAPGVVAGVMLPG